MSDRESLIILSLTDLKIEGRRLGGGSAREELRQRVTIGKAVSRGYEIAIMLCISAIRTAMENLCFVIF